MLAIAVDQFIRHPLSRRVADATLWLLAALHLAAALSLLAVLASVAPARAEEIVCGGRDLLAEMKADDPSRYAAIVEEAARTPNGHGLFWKIEKAGAETSWLLGTMHVTDPRVLKMPDGASEAAAKAKVVVIESDEILDEKKATAAILMNPELSMFTDGTTIADHLSKDDAAILEAGLKSRGLALGAVSRMKPWIIASFVALPACELSRKAKGASFLDKHIAEQAIAAGKPVKGLETLVEQLGALSELPIEFHLQALIETLAIGDRMADVMETMTELYLAGEVGMTMPMLKAVTASEGEDDSAYAAFEKRIVTDRNHLMAQRATPILDQGGAFIAVGALHLPGDEGLIELIRKQGFTVSAIE